jgi:hypothetical protein
MYRTVRTEGKRSGDQRGCGFNIGKSNAELLQMALMEAQYSLKFFLAANKTSLVIIYTS